MIYDPKCPRVSRWLLLILLGWIFWLPARPATAEIWRPDPDSNVQIQLKEPVDTSNDADAPLLVPDLVNDFDFALREICFIYTWSPHC
jgi:hypothetical protein